MLSMDQIIENLMCCCNFLYYLLHDFFEGVMDVFCVYKSVRWRDIYFLNKCTVTFVNVLMNKNEKKIESRASIM